MGLRVGRSPEKFEEDVSAFYWFSSDSSIERVARKILT